MITSTKGNNEMQIIEEVMTECLNTVAAHYASKIIASGVVVDRESLNSAIADNWDSISVEAGKLYNETINQLGA